MSIDVVEVQDVCAGVIQGDGTNLRARGCTVFRNGVGDYSILINPNNLGGPNLPQAESVSKVQPVGSDDEIVADLVHTTDIDKQVLLRNSLGAATDSDFAFRLSRLLG